MLLEESTGRLPPAGNTIGHRTQVRGLPDATQVGLSYAASGLRVNVASQLDRALGPPDAGRGSAVALAVALARRLDPEVGVDDVVAEGSSGGSDAGAGRVAPLAVASCAVARGVDDRVHAVEALRQRVGVGVLGIRVVVVRDVRREPAHRPR